MLHPLKIMNDLMFDTQLATIAILHDTIEDSNITIEYIKENGISGRVCTALELLTHKQYDNYLDVYIKNIASNYDAIRVKRKDLQHNSDISRLKGISEKDTARMVKYHTAFQFLGIAKQEFEGRR